MDSLPSRTGVEGTLSMRGGISSIETPIFIKHIRISYLYFPALLSNLIRNWMLGLSTAEEDNWSLIP